MDGTEQRGLAQENDALRRAIRCLHDVANLARASTDLRSTCHALLTGVTAGVGLGLNRAMLFLVDEERRDVLRGYAAVGPASAEEADRVWRSIMRDAPDLVTLWESSLTPAEPSALEASVRSTELGVEGETVVARALRRGEAVRGGGDAGGLFHEGTGLAAPVRTRERLYGVLYADNRFSAEPIDAVSELVFTLIAEHAGRVIEHARQYELLANEARTDSLTGLGHHGAMMAALGAAFGATVIGADPRVGLVMIDLDDFKQVNDRLGHLAGDALLAGVAARLRRVARRGEVPFRYGGEEFAILLPTVPDDNAVPTLAERVRGAIGDEPFLIGSDRTLLVTCSVGAAVRPRRNRAPEAEAEGLILAADGALLEAKRSGKNRVVLASPPSDIE